MGSPVFESVTVPFKVPWARSAAFPSNSNPIVNSTFLNILIKFSCKELIIVLSIYFSYIIVMQYCLVDYGLTQVEVDRVFFSYGLVLRCENSSGNGWGVFCFQINHRSIYCFVAKIIICSILFGERLIVSFL